MSIPAPPVVETKVTPEVVPMSTSSGSMYGWQADTKPVRRLVAGVSLNADKNGFAMLSLAEEQEVAQGHGANTPVP